MAAALSRVYAGLCRRDRLTSKECPFWLDSLFCDIEEPAEEAAHRTHVIYRTDIASKSAKHIIKVFPK